MLAAFRRPAVMMCRPRRPRRALDAVSRGRPSPAWRLLAAAAAVALLPACASPPAASAGPATDPAPSRPAPEVHVNSLGIEMVRIPAGSFTMGTDEPARTLAPLYPGWEARRLAELVDESPAQRVRLTRDFFMSRHEVTVGQFRRFLQASGHVPQSIADGTGGYGYDAGRARSGGPGDAFAGRDPRWSWRDPGFAQTDEHPVVNVTWHDAQALARWLSAVEQRRYRLPTEAEWEYACRAGGTGQFQHGDDLAGLEHSANLFDADAAPYWPQWRSRALPHHDGYAFTAPVGRFAANAFGLHDLHGNVWEWTADWYAEHPFAGADPREAVDDPQGPADGKVKVRRGGSWHTWPLYARCAYRNWNTRDTRYTLVGIRLVMDAR